MIAGAPDEDRAQMSTNDRENQTFWTTISRPISKKLTSHRIIPIKHPKDIDKVRGLYIVPPIIHLFRSIERQDSDTGFFGIERDVEV
jgi:hypothetical protein